jgi:FAD/FMN-containing dehydrogenase
MSSAPLPLIDDTDTLQHYGGDWTRFWPRQPSAVAFPESTEQLVELLRWARKESRALVPSGGRTGLSGGAVASRGEVVVSLERMRSLIELDTTEPSLSAQAGMAVGDVQRLASEQGLYYPVDWAAAGSAQLGGSIATNAGGIRVLRYGMTRQWVRGLTVVTGTGEVLRLNHGLLKNNAGVDLQQLFIGSEGTLGIITEATIGLVPAPPSRSVMLLGLDNLEAVMPAFAALTQALNLSAFEFFDHASIKYVQENHPGDFALDTECPFYAVVEFDDAGGSQQEAALEVFERLAVTGHLRDGAISQSDSQAAALWRWREGISEAISPYSPYKNDLSVRISKVPAFLDQLQALVARHYPEFEVIWFGHIGDGNLHMNVLKPEHWPVEQFRQACDKLSPEVFALTQSFNGSISAEHGVGLLKKPYLHYCRSDAEQALMRHLKIQLDPDGILNPGKVIDG